MNDIPEEKTTSKKIVKIILSVVALILSMFIGAAMSEILIGEAGPAATPLIWSIFIPTLFTIWQKTETEIKHKPALAGYIVGISIWVLGHALSENNMGIGVLLANISFVVAGLVTWKLFRKLN